MGRERVEFSVRHIQRAMAASALVLAAGLTGCSGPTAGTAGGGDGHTVTNKSASDVLKQFTGSVQDTLSTVGGTWSYRDNSAWKANQASDFTAHDCGNLQKTWQYSVTLSGPGDPDPGKAIQKVSDHWKSLGYDVGAAGGWAATPSALVPEQRDISSVTKDGVKLTYEAGTLSSTFSGESACSTSPTMVATGS
jgi:hypothetical protein